MTIKLARHPFAVLILLAVLVYCLPGKAFAQPRKNAPAAQSHNKNKPATNQNRTTNVNSNKNVHVNQNNNVNVNHNKNVNVHVNSSKNVHVHNSRGVVVIHNPRPYPHPPYVYAGHRYYCYHPYVYHPYHPFFWGPVWHPWGFFVATMAVTAMIITVESQQYHYDQGVYYVSTTGGYTVVPAPIGATVTTLPPATQTVVVTETTNNYYYGGTYYEKTDKGYTVVAPTAGTVVENLPEGGKEEKIGDITYVKVGETYYQPIKKDGKDMYEVVFIEDDKK